ncbi:hypothetical protein KMZ32_06420 [Phycicoccus sp. MAQZ13P-2]|uniref:hypothetical protein n=1 Tax=Phycicoccus mangrovi TaxID=2840470 RepID=UPI001C005E25|nr:hypothetical protein [Phycicoccus mangrovi]MBT9256299.1 hypothetical protein [Phycicoccus mangrovi]MBT9273704.1 hypothetical protein [Phycicoccus mangrovi]
MLTWDDITKAIGLTLGGDREEGGTALRACWSQTSETDHAQRCVIAHYLADLEAEVADEVMWDERALAEYEHVEGAELAPIGIPDAAGMAPSLHLNLGDGYLRQGRIADARKHVDAGLAGQHVLDTGGYGAMIRQGLARLADRVEAAER